MITGDLKRKIDGLWAEFWTGGISNPMTVVEQISYLMFIRILDIREDMSERILKDCYYWFHFAASSKEGDNRW